jgi:hypothetical protein
LNSNGNGSEWGGAASLYVLGAKQRKLTLKHEEEWHLYESALILEVDPQTGSARTRVEYKTPPEARASEHSSNVFKAGTLAGKLLYTCTSTEILVFELPEFKIVNYISLPCFNDLHHVTPDSDGNLFVASTGLDMVVKLKPDGTVLNEWDVLGEQLWSRFSRETDYRKVDSTKPHRSHPNFVFQLGDEIWATRFHQRDAICLSDSRKRIDIAIQSPHDGLAHSDRIYFTTVDGHIVIVNRRSLQVQQIIDLKEIDRQKSLLGWCRGLLPVDERRAWVGFTRVRKTNFRENVLWVSKIFRDGMPEKPTHLALYDLAEHKCLQEISLESHGMNVVFSIFPALLARTDAEDPAFSVTRAS